MDLEVDLGFDIRFTQKVRFYGINAPEKVTPEGKAASAYLKGLLEPGTAVIMRTLKDRTEKYGRYLGILWLPHPDPSINPLPNPADTLHWLDNSVNEVMVTSGHAVEYYGGPR